MLWRSLWGCSNGHLADVRNSISKAGKHFDYSESLEIETFIFSLYEDWKSGRSITNSANINEFSRRELTKELVAKLERLWV